MSVQRCMVETTSSDFVDWMDFRLREMNNPSRTDYYLAQIAAEMRRTVAKHPQKVKLTDYLLKFATKKKQEAPPTPEEIQRRTAVSKSIWFGLLKSSKKPPEGNT